MKAIRQKCLDCSCGSAKEVKMCTATDCALFNYRFGNNPARKGIGNHNVANIKKKTISSWPKISKKRIQEMAST